MSEAVLLHSYFLNFSYSSILNLEARVFFDIPLDDMSLLLGFEMHSAFHTQTYQAGNQTYFPNLKPNYFIQAYDTASDYSDSTLTTIIPSYSRDNLLAHLETHLEEFKILFIEQARKTAKDAEYKQIWIENKNTDGEIWTGQAYLTERLEAFMGIVKKNMEAFFDGVNYSTILAPEEPLFDFILKKNAYTNLEQKLSEKQTQTHTQKRKI